MALIELENVEKTYDDGTQALRGISFRIEKGDFVAIMGPSGSGKSTVLHILGFLDRHTKGTYRFEGKTIDDYSDEELAHIRNQKMGFVFQAFNLLPRATVLENVMLPLLYSSTRPSLREQMAKEAIEAVGLSHRLGHLSSGENHYGNFGRFKRKTRSYHFAYYARNLHGRNRKAHCAYSRWES